MKNYKKNYKSLKKEIEEDTIRWKDVILHRNRKINPKIHMEA
jgi:hypothetical protein